MTETKEILEEVRDLGRRLAGINVELPTAEALVEVWDCKEELDRLVELVAQQLALEHGVEWVDDSADANPES